jgi:endonuclease YncB( thermonuclease family)
VIDGDTIEGSPAVNGLKDVRLIGVDTPETVDPSEGVEPYGPQASEFTNRELSLRRVRLEFDKERVDRYGRLLANVYSDGSMFNEELVAREYAQALPLPAQHGARGAVRGGTARGQGRGARDLGAHRGAEVRAGGPGQRHRRGHPGMHGRFGTTAGTRGALWRR